MTWFNIAIALALVVVLAAQLVYRFSSGRLAAFFSKFKFKVFLRIVWFLSAILIFGVFVYWSSLQYRLWQDSEGFTKYLLPPYQNLGYFLSYVGTRFFSPWVLALLASVLVSRAAKFLNRRFEERFFEPEEIELIALGVFLTGYPGFLIYLSLILVLGVLASAIYQVFSKGRLPLYYFWIPTALSAMIIRDWAIPLLGWQFILGDFALGDFYKLIFGF